MNVEGVAGSAGFASAGGGRRDDRVLPATWWTAVVVTPILITAGVLLFFFPGDTAELWAWTINPPLTALVVGAGYLSGAVFFARGASQRRWHVMALGFLAATVLTVLLLTATIVHWDRFNHDHPAFWAWLSIYVVTPVLLPTLWALNRRRDPGLSIEAGAVVPGRVRAVLGTIGTLQLAVALVLFVDTSLADRLWPWPLSPLTARTIMAFVAFIGVMLAGFAFERRWDALRLLVDSAALGLALVALGVLRSYEDLTASPAVNALFLTLVLAVTVALVAVRFTVHESDHGAS